MPLYHTADQTMLSDSVTGLLADQGSIKRELRRLRDMDCQDGFGHDLPVPFYQHPRGKFMRELL